MLDTNTVSYFVNGRSAAVRRNYFMVEPSARLTLSVITESEIRFGLEQKPQALRLRKAFEDFFVTIEVLEVNSEVAKAYARLRTGLSTAGKSLSPMDLLIASHALAIGAVLVSHDRAFQHLSPWLTIVDWATDL